MGECRQTSSGELLYAQGEPPSDFFIVLDGKVAVLEGVGDDDNIIRGRGPRRFLGELGLPWGDREGPTLLCHGALGRG